MPTIIAYQMSVAIIEQLRIIDRAVVETEGSPRSTYVPTLYRVSRRTPRFAGPGSRLASMEKRNESTFQM